MKISLTFEIDTPVVDGGSHWRWYFSFITITSREKDKVDEEEVIKSMLQNESNKKNSLECVQRILSLSL
jgi:hypothetical protein